MEKRVDIAIKSSNKNELFCTTYTSMVHNKKIKNALRQQVKRRKKNTTIAAGNQRTVSHLIVKTYPPHIQSSVDLVDTFNQQGQPVLEEPAATMKEVLASLPGFSSRCSRRRSVKKLSVAAQLEAGLVDLESPASILTNTSLRALLNRHTFQGLPPLYQRKLGQLLPTVDRQDAAFSGLNNEFFARACLEWRKRLAEGEFTPENQQKLKLELEKDKSKLDPWKMKYFEPIWGEKKDQKLKSYIRNIDDDQNLLKNIDIALQADIDSGLVNINIRDNKPEMANINILVDEGDEDDDDLEDEIVSEDDEDIDEEYEDSCEEEDDDEDECEESSNRFIYTKDNTNFLNTDESKILKSDVEEFVSKNQKYNEHSSEKKLSFAAKNKIEKKIFMGNEKISYNNALLKSVKSEFCNKIKNLKFLNAKSALKNNSRRITDESCELILKIPVETVCSDNQVLLNNSKTSNSENPDFEMNKKNIEISEESRKIPGNIITVQNEITYATSNNPNLTEAGTNNLLLTQETSNSIKHSETVLIQEEDAFQEANNYVCSEMMDYTWNSVKKCKLNALKEDVQTNWPTVAASFDITSTSNAVVPIYDCKDTKLSLNKNKEVEAVLSSFADKSENTFLSPTIQNKTISTEALAVSTSAAKYVRKNANDQNQSLVTIPHLQSIHFFQSCLQTTLSHDLNKSAACFYSNSTFNNMRNSSVKLNVNNEKYDTIKPNFNLMSGPSKLKKNSKISESCSKNTVYLQSQQSLSVTSPIITSLPQTSRSVSALQPVTATMLKTNLKNSLQGSRNRNSSNNNGNKTRSIPREPPGIVNLERSYQICQAVIANSPNRDQLKAHLRPPPSLLTKLDKKNTEIKFENRTGSTLKTKRFMAKPSLSSIKNQKQLSTLSFNFSAKCCNKSDEAINYNRESVLENFSSDDNQYNQYVIVKKSESNETPRASSAPPLPKQVLHVVRGRPASANDKALEKDFSKVSENDTIKNNILSYDASIIKLDYDIPAACECNIKDAMITCQKCGMFCHKECIGTQFLCSSCDNLDIK